MATTFLQRQFPQTRLRRSRQQSWSRALCAEHHLRAQDLILPLFVIENDDPRPRHLPNLPGIRRLTITEAVTVTQDAQAAGIPAVALFPVVDPTTKSADGREAYRKDNLICRAVRTIKANCPDIGVITDVALDPYTDHGHDGIVVDDYVDNDYSVVALQKQAACLLAAGADVLAPSDMMDGRISAIRHVCEENGHPNTLILSYAAKYRSSFYDPFREAIDSKGCLGKAGKETYQQDPANGDEALHEVALDLKEGADWVMVKPGMPYLDIIHRVKSTFAVPTFAYQVSGEYAMLHRLAGDNQENYLRLMNEALLSFKRAGADGILTYAALDMAHAWAR